MCTHNFECAYLFTNMCLLLSLLSRLQKEKPSVFCYESSIIPLTTFVLPRRKILNMYIEFTAHSASYVRRPALNQICMTSSCVRACVFVCVCVNFAPNSKIFLLEFGVVQMGVISRFKIQENNCNISTCSTIMKYN